MRDSKTTIEGKLRSQVRVTVRYKALDNGGFMALHIIVRSTGNPKTAGDKITSGTLIAGDALFERGIRGREPASNLLPVRADQGERQHQEDRQ